MATAQIKTLYPTPDTEAATAPSSNVAVQLDGVLKRFGNSIALQKVS